MNVDHKEVEEEVSGVGAERVVCSNHFHKRKLGRTKREETVKSNRLKKLICSQRQVRDSEGRKRRDERQR